MAALAVALLLVSMTSNGLAAEWTGEVTLGVDAHEPGSPRGDDNDSTSFFDQYRYLFNKNNSLPIFVDIVDSDLGLVRPDGHYLFRLQRKSPNWLNDRTRIMLDYPGLFRVDVDFSNYRSEKMRAYPQDSGTTSSSAFGTQFNDDTSGVTRFWSRRTEIGGAVTLGPDLLGGGEGGILRSLNLRTRYEQRSGNRQFRLMLGGSDRTSSANWDFARWRGVEQEVDDKVFSPGGEMVLSFGGATGVVRLDYERFTSRERAITNATLDAYAASAGQVGAIDAAGAKAERTVNYIPDTERYTGSIRLARRFGSRAGLRVDGQWGSFAQQSFSALEHTTYFKRNRIRSFGGSMAGDFQLSDAVSFNAFSKLMIRDRDAHAESLVSAPSDERIDRRKEWRIGAEVAMKQRKGSMAVGWERKSVDRTLAFPLGSSDQILEHNALIADDTVLDTIYLKGRTRPARGVRVSGRLHYTAGSHTGTPLEPEMEYGARARASWASSTQPLLVSAFGRYRSWKNERFGFVGETAGPRDNDLENDSWTLGADATLVPAEGSTLFWSASFQRAKADNDLVRTNIRRFLEPSGTLDFYYDGTTTYRSNVLTSVVGWRFHPMEGAELSATYSFSRSNVDVTGNGNVIDRFTDVQSNIHRVNASFSQKISDAMTIGTRYEYSDYGDQTRGAPELTGISEHQHIFGIRLKYRFQAM